MKSKCKPVKQSSVKIKILKILGIKFKDFNRNLNNLKINSDNKILNCNTIKLVKMNLDNK